MAIVLKNFKKIDLTNPTAQVDFSINELGDIPEQITRFIYSKGFHAEGKTESGNTLKFAYILAYDNASGNVYRVSKQQQIILAGYIIDFVEKRFNMRVRAEVH